MNMGYRVLIFRFGYQDAPIVRIQGFSKNVKKKISFSYETDTKNGTILRFRFKTIGTQTFEIYDFIEIGAIKCMKSCVHTPLIFAHLA